MEKVEHYNRTLKVMSQSLQQMIQFAKLVGVESIVEEGHELLDRMMRSTFTLAVTGEVSAGKSTFLNGLLKEQTLPTQMKETTALITKIKKGEREILLRIAGEIVYQTKNFETFNEAFVVREKRKNQSNLYTQELIAAKSKFEQLLHTGEVNPESDEILINLPHPLLKQDIEITDTPGVNDLTGRRELITHQYIKKADAAIFITKASKLASHSEMSFFENHLANKHTDNLFVVVNKMDELTPPEILEVKRAAFEKFTGQGVKRQNIFFVSSRKAEQYHVIQKRLDYSDSILKMQYETDQEKFMKGLNLKKEKEQYQDGWSFEETLAYLRRIESMRREIGGLHIVADRLDDFFANEIGAARLQTFVLHFQVLRANLLAKINEELEATEESRIELMQSVRDKQQAFEGQKVKIKQEFELQKTHVAKIQNEAKQKLEKELNAFLNRFVKISNERVYESEGYVTQRYYQSLERIEHYIEKNGNEAVTQLITLLEKSIPKEIIEMMHPPAFAKVKSEDMKFRNTNPDEEFKFFGAIATGVIATAAFSIVLAPFAVMAWNAYADSKAPSKDDIQSMYRQTLHTEVQNTIHREIKAFDVTLRQLNVQIWESINQAIERELDAQQAVNNRVLASMRGTQKERYERCQLLRQCIAGIQSIVFEERYSHV